MIIDFILYSFKLRNVLGSKNILIFNDIFIRYQKNKNKFNNDNRLKL